MDALLLAAALLVAFANGANDNFKSVASLWSSDLLDYRRALRLTTVATLAGALLSLWLAHALLVRFAGHGLVPEANLTPAFITAVALAGAATVLLATRLGYPVSTTHALLGALVGSGLASAGAALRLQTLAHSFVLPLLFSPLAAALLAALAHRALQRRLGQADCLCLDPLATPDPGGTLSATATRLVAAPASACCQYPPALRFSVRRGLDRVHLASALTIAAARGLNDTPKIAALLLTVDPQHGIALIAAAMGLGGLLLSGRVARTLGRELCRLDPVQGVAANLVTSGLVLAASLWGLPVSTTHVATGSLAGVGQRAGGLNRLLLGRILLAWLVTLPLAAVLAYAIRLLLGNGGE